MDNLHQQGSCLCGTANSNKGKVGDPDQIKDKNLKSQIEI